jgi:tetratricopeptide (TPR) repeat protein
VDLSRIAAVGHSWGGISNLFAAARDNRIGALVFLDGSMRYFPGLVKQAGDVHPEQMTIPLLFFAQRDFSLEDQDRYLTKALRDGPNVLNAWRHGDLTYVHVLGLSHPEFTSAYQRNENMWWNIVHVSPTMQDDYGRDDAVTGYTWMARYTLQFLNAYLKHEVAAMAFLKRNPAENGAPPHTLSVNYRAAEGAPASLEEFRAQIGRKGFEHAADIYAAFHRQDSDFNLDEEEITDWSKELINDNHLSEAIMLLKLNVALYQDSSTAYVSLGDAYRKIDQKQLAIDNYRMALEKDRSNGVAKRKLEELSVAIH